METTNHRKTAAGELCQLQAGSLTIELFKSAKYSGTEWGFRPSKILRNNAVVWSFLANSHIRFGELLQYGDEYIIALCDTTTVYEVVRIKDFEHTATAKIGDKVITVGGSSVEELLDIKIAIARELDLDYWFSANEGDILRCRTEARRIATEAENAEEERAREEARARREGFIRDILGRKTLEAWSSEGKHYFGIPVTNDAEWMCLPDGKYCIMMKDGQPIEAFIVMKKGSRVKKINPTPVTGNMPVTAQQETIPEALDQRTVTIRGESRSILIFTDMKAVKQLQKAGLNSGTWVGVLDEGNDLLMVYAVRSNNIDTVGIVKQRQAA